MHVMRWTKLVIKDWIVFVNLNAPFFILIQLIKDSLSLHLIHTPFLVDIATCISSWYRIGNIHLLLLKCMSKNNAPYLSHWSYSFRYETYFFIPAINLIAHTWNFSNHLPTSWLSSRQTEKISAILHRCSVRQAGYGAVAELESKQVQTTDTSTRHTRACRCQPVHWFQKKLRLCTFLFAMKLMFLVEFISGRLSR
jgi:hypothetical protein